MSAETFAKIAEHAKAHNIPMSQIVEQLSRDIPQLEPAVPSTDLAVASRERRGQLSPTRQKLSAQRTRHRALLRAKLKLERANMLRERAAVRVKGTPEPPPPPQFPEGAFCGVCAEDCKGELYQEPIGRNDALINVCERCRQEGL